MSDTTIGTEVHDDSPDHSQPVLEIQGLTKSFGPLSVLRGVDMTLHRGEVLGLVGDNGAGKSTLVKIISGLFSQDSGRVLVNGQRGAFPIRPRRHRARDRDRVPGPGPRPPAARVPEPVPQP